MRPALISCFSSCADDPGDDVGEICARLDAGELRGFDERGDHVPVRGATVGADEERVLLGRASGRIERSTVLKSISMRPSGWAVRGAKKPELVRGSPRKASETLAIPFTLRFLNIVRTSFLTDSPALHAGTDTASKAVSKLFAEARLRKYHIRDQRHCLRYDRSKGDQRNSRKVSPRD